MQITELEVNRLRDWAAMEACRRSWDGMHYLNISTQLREVVARVFLADGTLVAEKRL